MALDRTDFVSQDSAVERAILLSEQSQLLFLTAIDYISSRNAWDDMNDAQWNEISGMIGDAQSQLLLIQSGGSMNIEQKDVSLSSNFTITGTQTSQPVDWNIGDYDATDNSRVYVENTGRFIITANVDIDSAGGNRGEPELWINGSFVAGLILSAASNRSYSISLTIDLSSGDYVQLKVTTNGTLDISQSAWASRMNLTGFYA